MEEKNSLSRILVQKEKREGQYSFDLDEIKKGNSGASFIDVKPSDIMSTLRGTFEKGKPMGYSTGISVLDPILRWRRRGGLYGVSAYPQAGKSEFLKFISVQASKSYDWKVNMYSPEEDVDDIYEDLCKIWLSKNVNKIFKGQCTWNEYQKAIKWVEGHFNIMVFDGMADFEMLINAFNVKAKQGYNIFITDPWNSIAEGSFDKNSFGNSYLKTALTHMHSFAKKHSVHNIIVEHQNRPVATKNGVYPKAHVRNMTGGQMWENKCDLIVLLHNYWTEDEPDNSVEIQVAKSKNQKYNGRKGSRVLYFDILTGHYLESEPKELVESDLEIDFTDDEDAPF